MSIVVGVDESGTGAWAGPFFVVAVAADDRFESSDWARRLNDSKKLSDKVRRELYPIIIEQAVCYSAFEVTVDLIRHLGSGAAWRRAVESTVADVMRLVPSDSRVIIDGPKNEKTRLVECNVEWIPKADAKFKSVMAASIIAKTLRNDAMIKIHHEYPAYNWRVNAGYGVPHHIRTIESIGITRHHRNISAINDIMRTWANRP